MSNKDKHVVPKVNGGWGVRETGAMRTSRTFVTQKDAVRYARSTAISERTGMYIHARDGTIKGKESYIKSSNASRKGK
jgi:hypothetical protein